MTSIIFMTVAVPLCGLVKMCRTGRDEQIRAEDRIARRAKRRG